ncbi:MAG: dockerin type I repeat-containing protein, partial [Gemmatimonadota bacterium]
LRNYLHADFVRNESGDGVIYGVRDDPISGGILFFSTMGDPGANNQVSPDVIAPLDGASTVFTYGPPVYEGAAVKYGGDSYRVVFFGFGFEGIVNLLGDTETLRSQIMSDVLSWLHFSNQRGDVNGDGEIDLLDLIRTVNVNLGVEPGPTEYELWASDCTNDGTIDLFDLVGTANVILGTGTCEP